MPSSSKATHFLVPLPVRQALQRMSDETNVSLEEYLREAVSDLLEKYAAALPGAAPCLPAGPMVSILPRLGTQRRQGLSELVARTRVRQSELLREAVADVLAKHGRPLLVPPAAPPVLAIRRAPRPSKMPAAEAALKRSSPRCAFDCGFPLTPENVIAALSSGDWRCTECRADA